MSEMDIKQFVFRKGAARRIPVSGTFEITSRCNFNCRMCYIHMSPEEQAAFGKELSTDEWLRLGRDAVSEGMIYLLLTGGEPLLRHDFITLYTEFIRMGVMISINTNGALITSEILECFQKYRPEKVNVTLYGMSDESYNRLCGVKDQWKTVIENIKVLKKAGIQIALNTTFTKYNLYDMESIIAFAREVDIPIRMSSFIFPPVRNGHAKDDIYLLPHEMGRAAAKFDYLTMDNEQLKKRVQYIKDCLNGDVIPKQNIPESRISTCMAGKGAFWISWDGKMYPCGMLADFSENVCSSGFKEGWKRICEIMKNVYLPSECSMCRYQPVCPSCAAVSQCCQGRSDSLVQELCIRTKAYTEAFLNGQYMSV